MSRLARFTLAVALVSAVVGVGVQPDAAAAARWRVGIVGDSLTSYASSSCGERAAIDHAGFGVVGLDGKGGRTILGGYTPWQPSWRANVAVIGLGTNDTRLWDDPTKWRRAIRTMIGRVGPSTKIVWVNVWRWDGTSRDRARGQRLATQFNAILTQEIGRLGRRATIADWAASASHHRGWTVADGIHDTITGCRMRIGLITTALHTLLDPPKPPPTSTTTATTSTTTTSTTIAATTTTVPPTSTLPTTTTDPDQVTEVSPAPTDAHES